jgi:hypothetical protein
MPTGNSIDSHPVIPVERLQYDTRSKRSSRVQGSTSVIDAHQLGDEQGETDADGSEVSSLVLLGGEQQAESQE